MTPNKYQQLAFRTLIDGPTFTLTDNEFMIIWNALDLAGEAGEVVDMVKKGLLHRHGLDKEKMVKELGDVMWYVAALCTKLDIDLSDVLAQNIAKLQERYPDGFSSGDSLKRVDVAR